MAYIMHGEDERPEFLQLDSEIICQLKNATHLKVRILQQFLVVALETV